MALGNEILVATGNRNKVREIAEILGSGWNVSSLLEHPEIQPAEETGETFRANAEMKAVGASRHFAGYVLADDSGLEVDALGGRPGVYSARYAGKGADDASNRRKLIDELRGTGARGRERTARFRCVIAIALRGDVLECFEGAVEGVIANADRGAGGFGYDPLFIPCGECRTFAELPAEAKHAVSHRGRALRQAAEWLKNRKAEP